MLTWFVNRFTRRRPPGLPLEFGTPPPRPAPSLVVAHLGATREGQWLRWSLAVLLREIETFADCPRSPTAFDDVLAAVSGVAGCAETMHATALLDPEEATLAKAAARQTRGVPWNLS